MKKSTDKNYGIGEIRLTKEDAEAALALESILGDVIFGIEPPSDDGTARAESARSVMQHPLFTGVSPDGRKKISDILGSPTDYQGGHVLTTQGQLNDGVYIFPNGADIKFETNGVQTRISAAIEIGLKAALAKAPATANAILEKPEPGFLLPPIDQLNKEGIEIRDQICIVRNAVLQMLAILGKANRAAIKIHHQAVRNHENKALTWSDHVIQFLRENIPESLQRYLPPKAGPATFPTYELPPAVLPSNLLDPRLTKTTSVRLGALLPTQIQRAGDPDLGHIAWITKGSGYVETRQTGNLGEPLTVASFTAQGDGSIFIYPGVLLDKQNPSAQFVFLTEGTILSYPIQEGDVSSLKLLQSVLAHTTDLAAAMNRAVHTFQTKTPNNP